jgi:dipeptidyl aminopeptidase/acylaminoacyl peptidase
VIGALDGIKHVLVVHGQNDGVVPVAHAHRIYALAGDPKRLVIQEGGDHRMSDMGHQQTFLNDVLAWIGSSHVISSDGMCP